MRGLGRQIMHYAAETIIPQTMELGGKSPNIFFADVMDENDAFLDKALEGFALFAFNKGEVCTCPSRALVQDSIFDKFVERAVARVARIKVGDPLDPSTQMGAQCSKGQLEKILSYIEIGKREGATCLTGGGRAELGGRLKHGFFVQPTVFVGSNKMRIFQEEIFGPVLSVTAFKDLDEAIAIGNETPYGLGAGVWSRNVNNCIVSAAASRLAGYGRTAITSIRPMRPSAATRAPASGARHTKWCWIITSKRRMCWSATIPRPWVCSESEVAAVHFVGGSD